MKQMQIGSKVANTTVRLGIVSLITWMTGLNLIFAAMGLVIGMINRTKTDRTTVGIGLVICGIGFVLSGLALLDHFKIIHFGLLLNIIVCLSIGVQVAVMISGFCLEELANRMKNQPLSDMGNAMAITGLLVLAVMVPLTIMILGYGAGSTPTTAP